MTGPLAGSIEPERLTQGALLQPKMPPPEKGLRPEAQEAFESAWSDVKDNFTSDVEKEAARTRMAVALAAAGDQFVLDRDELKSLAIYAARLGSGNFRTPT